MKSLKQFGILSVAQLLITASFIAAQTSSSFAAGHRDRSQWECHQRRRHHAFQQRVEAGTHDGDGNPRRIPIRRLVSRALHSDGDGEGIFSL